MKKNEIIQKIKSKKFLNFVLNHLKEQNINEDYGIYTGQSLCNLFLEFIDFRKNIIINDYDIFKLIKNSVVESLKKEEKNEIEHLISSKPDIDFKNNRYKELSFKYKSISIYKSIKENKKNIIYCQQNHDENLRLQGKDLIKIIIECFDVNCCMIGLCLETKEIYYTKDFLDFILTKSLKIVNFRTPGISYLRLLRKSKELNIELTNKEINNAKSKLNINSILYLSMANIEKIKDLMLEFNVYIVKNIDFFEQENIQVNNKTESDIIQIIKDLKFSNCVKLKLTNFNKNKEKKTNLLIENFSKYKKYYNQLLKMIKKDTYIKVYDSIYDIEFKNLGPNNEGLNESIIAAYFYKKEKTEKELKNFFNFYKKLNEYIDFENKEEVFHILKIINLITLKNQLKNKTVNIKKIVYIYKLYKNMNQFIEKNICSNELENYIKKYSLEKIIKRLNYIKEYSSMYFTNNVLIDIEKLKIKYELENF